MNEIIIMLAQALHVLHTTALAWEPRQTHYGPMRHQRTPCLQPA